MEELDKQLIVSRRRIMNARRLALLSGGGNSEPPTPPVPPVPPEVYEPLTFICEADMPLKYIPSTNTTAEYSYDKETWYSFDNVTVNLTAGDILYVRGVISGNQGENSYARFDSEYSTTGRCKITGNIMSLYDYDDFEVNNTISYTYAFCKLFTALSNNITSINGLQLPATTLTTGCYYSLFSSCSKMNETDITLPAKSLAGADMCYAFLFQNCTSLITAPVIAAETLSTGCMAGMFYGCNQMAASPVLHATTLTQQAYQQMFSGCSKLKTITSYASNISAYRCLYNWVTGVASGGDFYNLGGASYPRSNSGIPSSWTIKTS